MKKIFIVWDVAISLSLYHRVRKYTYILGLYIKMTLKKKNNILKFYNYFKIIFHKLNVISCDVFFNYEYLKYENYMMYSTYCFIISI